VADWPIDCDEMELYYAEAERLIGVAGLRANPSRSGAVAYSMPPGADGGAVPRRSCGPRLTRPVSTGVNSVPYDGRPAQQLRLRGFYGCPIEAKGDPVAPPGTAPYLPLRIRPGADCRTRRARRIRSLARRSDTPTPRRGAR
jgi:hypothetical protein